MSERDLDILIELALVKLNKGVSKDEATTSFVRAGIIDLNGNYTSPYKTLERVHKVFI